MTNEYLEKLSNQLIKHEGVKLTVYKCPAGKLTIGIGRNLEDRGITTSEAMLLLQNDINNCIAELSQNFILFKALDYARQCVLINMCFNLGITRLKKFKKMFAAIEKEDWNLTACEMLNSGWAEQVGHRAEELATQMRTGIML